MSHFFSRLFGSGPSSRLTSVHKREKQRTRLFLEELENRIVPQANPYQVTTLSDDPNVPIPNETTLRDAINNAIGAGGNVTITFAVGGTIQLQAALPTLSVNMTIDNTQTASVQVAGSGGGAQNLYRVFKIANGKTCEIDNLVISNGYVSGSNGGGVYNAGTLTLNNDSIINNSAVGTGGDGGGIYNVGTLNLVSTHVTENNAAQEGGGVFNSLSGTVNISGNSEIIGNQASDGGGILNLSTLNIKTGTDINQNTATGNGGGVENSGGGKMTVSGALFHQNSGSNGGGIYVNGGGLTVKGGTVFSTNSAKTGNGGGIYINSGTVTISGGTVENNTANSGNGGGIYSLAGTLSLIGGVTIGSGNSAINGGGLYLGAKSTTSFGGCTVSGNKLSSTSGKGVGVAYEAGATLIGVALGLTDKDDPNGPVQV